MTTNIDSTWKTSDPTSVGLYIASTERRADYVRAWTGKHWTAPCHVSDLHLPGRMPRVDGPPAETDNGKPIEWLEAVVFDAAGFISWGGKINQAPLKRPRLVEVRLRNGERALGSSTTDWRWKHDGGAADIVAYRVVQPDEVTLVSAAYEAANPLPAAAGLKDTNPKDAAASSRVPMHLVPDSLMLFAAMGFAEGDSKYIGYNFRVAGVRASVYVSALRRHLMRYFNGEWADKKTGVPHLASVASCVAILIDGHVVGNIVDDRPPAVDLGDEVEEAERVIAHCYRMNAGIRAKAPVKEYTALSTGTTLAQHAPHKA